MAVKNNEVIALKYLLTARVIGARRNRDLHSGLRNNARFSGAVESRKDNSSLG